MQQQLLPLATRIAPPRRDASRTWLTGAQCDRQGPAAFLHLVRSADDPTETAGRGAGRRGTSSNNPAGVNSRGAEHWRIALTDLLADDVPRTFNRMSIELTGRSADAMFQTDLDRVLWTLVELGQVEHTNRVPILFRRRRGQGRAV